MLSGGLISASMLLLKVGALGGLSIGIITGIKYFNDYTPSVKVKKGRDSHGSDSGVGESVRKKLAERG